MAVDPSYELQRAVYAALAAANVAGGAIFHRVPAQQPLPFAYIGEDLIEGDPDAGPHSRAEVKVDVFAKTRPDAKLQLALVRQALEVDLTVTGFLCTESIFESARFVREPDGLSEHVVVKFSYLLIPLSA